jgi:hypothetical protein
MIFSESLLISLVGPDTQRDHTLQALSTIRGPFEIWIFNCVYPDENISTRLHTTDYMTTIPVQIPTDSFDRNPSPVNDSLISPQI